MTTTATITIHRPARARDRARAYKLEVDGVVRDKIRAGREVSVEVEPGAHHVRATIDWTGSPPLDVETTAGEEVHVQVEPSGAPWMFWQVFGRTGWLRLYQVEPGMLG